MEVTAGLEPAKTGFADQRLGLFGIATKLFALQDRKKSLDTCRVASFHKAFRRLPDHGSGKDRLDEDPCHSTPDENLD